ncbi:MAG TPA: hypothetical protein VGL95_14730 [Acetobacteraceae bacterium]|jgi:hypothetical protein
MTRDPLTARAEALVESLQEERLQALDREVRELRTDVTHLRTLAKLTFWTALWAIIAFFVSTMMIVVSR